MILAILYFFIFCWVVYKLPFFKDAPISFKWIFVIFCFKIAACFAYYHIYFSDKLHLLQGDSYDTLMGANIMFQAIHESPLDYLKMIFGIHSDLETDALYRPYFEKINDWSQTKPADNFFLNDNRTSVRFHAFIQLFSFGYYSVHALVMLMVSFVGQFAFYKTFKLYFPQKEKLLAIIVFLAPSVLFWTAGILKEPIALCIMGFFIFSFFKLFIHNQSSIKIVSCFIISTLSFLVLKPYILILLALPLIIYTLVQKNNIKKIALFYTIALIFTLSFSIVVLKYAFNKDVIKTIVVRQNDFINLSKGGIFFNNDKQFVRLECNDTNSFVFIDAKKIKSKIKPHAKLMLWKRNFPNDTIFVNDNADTTIYTYLSASMPAGSAIAMERLTYSVKSFVKLIPIAFYHVIAKPFFYDSHSGSEFVASLENLGYLFFFIFCFYFRQKIKVDKNLMYLLISTIVLSFLLIGITTTVMGAIVRYKVPFIPFLLMTPLLMLDVEKIKKLPFIRKLV